MTKNRLSRTVLALAAGSLIATAACQSGSTTATSDTAPAEAAPAAAAPAPTAAPTVTAPDRIRLQHILISFAGKVPGKPVTRSQEEARTLAAQILDRARKGEDFDALVTQYTDDRAPGIYALSNSGVAPAQGEFSRDRMVPAFGDVGFSLAVGEIGMADYDPVKSPYGWHIIKRIE